MCSALVSRVCGSVDPPLPCHSFFLIVSLKGGWTLSNLCDGQPPAVSLDASIALEALVGLLGHKVVYALLVFFPYGTPTNFMFMCLYCIEP